MSYANILITGASRGIGLELVKQYAVLPTTKLLFATCRSSSGGELRQFASQNQNVKIIELDVKEYERYDSIYDLVEKEVGKDGLNLLVNNAAIHIK